ncbi:hypothetical protein AB8O64_20945 [Streptomyces sp. QH1-20]|uniref:hypothetical protein n=1 Tax=Streptomyces sp. QH1-20 TaxID=3240934 RepID=UPI00351159AE
MNREHVKVAAVTAGLTGWLLATTVSQCPDQRFDALLRRGRLRIPVPNWRFFGPNPGVKDIHLLYRNLADEKPGAWQEVPVTQDRPWYALAWNARNRAPKALFDACQDISLVARAYANNLDVVGRTPGYRCLADYIRQHLTHTEGASAAQFLLMESYPTSLTEREMKPVFASPEIPLHSAVAA